MHHAKHRQGGWPHTNKPISSTLPKKAHRKLWATGSQVQSGEDIDLESAGMAVKMTMGDDIEQLDSSANPTGETKFSSFWDAYPICTTLGTANCGESQEANVPQTLGTVADGASFFHNEAIDGAINSLLNVSNPIGFFVSGICWAFNWLDLLDPLGNLIGGIISSAISALNNATGLFNDLIYSAAGYFLGTPVDLATITPEQWGQSACTAVNSHPTIKLVNPVARS